MAHSIPPLRYFTHVRFTYHVDLINECLNGVLLAYFSLTVYARVYVISNSG